MNKLKRLRESIKSASYVCLFFTATALPCAAGDDNYTLGARAAGMGATVAVNTDVWAAANNQAGMAFAEHASASLYYENRWTVKGLGIQAATVTVPVKNTVIGLNCRRFGYSQYNETKVGLAVAKKLWDKIAVGVQMDWFNTVFPNDYGSFNVLSAEIGLLYEPIENLFVGAHLFNATNSRNRANPDERIPMIMRFGAGYTIADRATVTVETEKDLRMDAVFKLGLEFIPIKSLKLRCGLSNSLNYRYTFGLGYDWKRFTIDFSMSNHWRLGYSQHVGLSVWW